MSEDLTLVKKYSRDCSYRGSLMHDPFNMLLHPVRGVPSPSQGSQETCVVLSGGFGACEQGEDQ